MIILAPITVTQGEAAALRFNYRDNGTGFDFTGYTGTWVIVQRANTVLSGTVDLEADGDIFLDLTVAQIELLSAVDQYRGRTLAETYWQATATDGTTTLHFRAAVNVVRGLGYSGAVTLATSSGVSDDSGNTLLAE